MPGPSVEPTGTRLSGLTGAESGPFKCGNCVHFASKGTCAHPVVIADPEVDKDAAGLAIVEAEECCYYFRPLQRKEKAKYRIPSRTGKS